MKNYDTLSPSLNRTKSNISSLFIPKSNTFSFVTFILFRNMPPERDISVLKLLGFETFVNFWRASVSVPENLVLEKNSVSENNSRYRFWSNFWSRHSVYSTRPYQTSRFPYCVFSSVLSWKTAGSGNSMGVNNFWASFSMRSDNLQLTCVKPPNSLQILPLRLFK